MRSFKACAAILFALSVVGPACAEDEVQKSETEFFVQTSGGNSEVCGLDYTIMYIDHTYRHGDLAGVRGSLSWMEGNGSINTILIIKGFNLNATSPIPFPVFQGFVIVDGKSVLPDRVGNSCTVLVSPQTSVVHILLKRRLRFWMRWQKRRNWL